MHHKRPTSECKKSSSDEAEEEDLGHVELLKEEVGVPSEIFFFDLTLLPWSLLYMGRDKCVTT